MLAFWFIRCNNYRNRKAFESIRIDTHVHIWIMRIYLYTVWTEVSKSSESASCKYAIGRVDVKVSLRIVWPLLVTRSKSLFWICLFFKLIKKSYIVSLKQFWKKMDQFHWCYFFEVYLRKRLNFTMMSERPCFVMDTIRTTYMMI